MLVKEKLEEAFDARDNNIKSYVWKGEKREINGEKVQEEYRLIDCSESQLRNFYEHCLSMLKNKDQMHPGRYVLLDIIKDQRDRCNAELYIRYLEKGSEDRKPYPRYVYLSDLNKVLDINRDSITKEMQKTVPISVITGGVPEEFSNLPIDLVLDGCLDTLGKFNKQHITLTFILKQGVWFTPQEMKDLLEKDKHGQTRDRLEVVKERLNLKPSMVLKVNPKGLTYSALRSMVNLKSKKYSDLTTEQLLTLRNKILFMLEDEVKYHINQWETRMQQIEKVAAYHGYTL